MAREYFVSLHRDTRTALIDGPYATQDEAAEAMPGARAFVRAADPWTDFDTLGVASIEDYHGPIPWMRRVDA